MTHGNVCAPMLAITAHVIHFCCAFADGLTVSCDISEDEELFMGQGDYQFDIYRIMRQENRCVCPASSLSVSTTTHHIPNQLSTQSIS